MSMFGDWFSEDEDDILWESKIKIFDVSREASKILLKKKLIKLLKISSFRDDDIVKIKMKTLI